MHADAPVPDSAYPSSQAKLHVTARAASPLQVVVTPAARSEGAAHVDAAQSDQSEQHNHFESIHKH